MKAVWNGLAGALFASGIAATPVAVQAADIYDAWINVFEVRAFRISSVTTETTYNSQGNQVDKQIIKGTNGGQPMELHLQRSAGGSGYRAGFSDAEIDNMARSASTMIRVYKIPENEASDHRSFRGNAGRGASIDRGACRTVAFGVRGNAAGGGFEILAQGVGCGDKAAFTDYFEKTLRKSDRAANMAQANLAGSAPQPPAAPQKPVLEVNCEAATGDSAKMAIFMRGLSQEQLTRFLGAKQTCAYFAGP